MTPLAFLLWFSEFALESFGTCLAFRKRIWPLFAYLGFRAGADLVDVLIFAHSQRAFYISDQVQRTMQLPLLAVLIIYAAGHLLRESWQIVKLYAAAGALISMKAAIVYHAAVPITCANLLRFELFSNLVLCGMLAIALGSAEGKMDHAWKAIATGAMIQTASEWALTMGLLGGIDTARLYPLGAIPALLALCYAGRGKWKEDEFRRGLGKKFPASCYGDPEKVVGKAV